MKTFYLDFKTIAGTVFMSWKYKKLRVLSLHPSG